LSSTGMLTKPNVSEPFQIAAIRAPPISEWVQWCGRKQLICRLWKTSFVMPVNVKKPRGSGAFLSEALN
jgi:hypothetical protein